jgi:hypothetical protein
VAQPGKPYSSHEQPPLPPGIPQPFLPTRYGGSSRCKQLLLSRQEDISVPGSSISQGFSRFVSYFAAKQTKSRRFRLEGKFPVSGISLDRLPVLRLGLMPAVLFVVDNQGQMTYGLAREKSPFQVGVG